MIPQSSIDAWRETAPWSSDLQVEQDLVVSRAVAELFADSGMHELVAMRGGTILNKFFVGGGSRYPEDIDLVKVGTVSQIERAKTITPHHIFLTC